MGELSLFIRPKNRLKPPSLDGWLSASRWLYDKGMKYGSVAKLTDLTKVLMMLGY